MLDALRPVLRSDRDEFARLRSTFGPDADSQLSIAWFVAGRGAGPALLAERAVVEAVRGHAICGRLSVLTSPSPALLAHLVAAQNRCRRGAVPLRTLLGDRTLSAEIQVERVIPTRLFGPEDAGRMRYRHTTTADLRSVLPSDAWHVAVVAARLGRANLVVAVACMAPGLFLYEVVEAHWLAVRALVTLGMDDAEVEALHAAVANGTSAVMHGVPPLRRIQPCRGSARNTGER